MLESSVQRVDMINILTHTGEGEGCVRVAAIGK